MMSFFEDGTDSDEGSPPVSTSNVRRQPRVILSEDSDTDTEDIIDSSVESENATSLFPKSYSFCTRRYESSSVTMGLPKQDTSPKTVNEDYQGESRNSSPDIVEISDDEVATTKTSFAHSNPVERTVTSQDSLDKKQQIMNTSSVLEIVSNNSQNGKATSSESSTVETKPDTLTNTKREVSQQDYARQQQNVHMLLSQLNQSRAALSKINLKTLADKGQSLKDRDRRLQQMYVASKQILDGMFVKDSKLTAVQNIQNKIGIAWDEINAEVGAVGPRTFGKKGMAQFNAEKKLTVDALDNLHKSLDTRPSEKEIVEDPYGLKVDLMQHQKRALAWLLWREQQSPSGGLLADDMGLGKTLTMIALVMKSKDAEIDIEREMKRELFPGGTLVVCPASLLNQWSGEVDRRVKRYGLSVEQYHGPKRETKAKRLAQHDLVITTYAIIMSEDDRRGAVFRVNWRRIIIDEGHQIRNFKSKTSVAVCNLSGKSRWVLTGTPVHNKELDMYALLKFLRCSPFDDLRVWKHWVSDKSVGGQERLHAVISSIMLRRTKTELMATGELQSLPERQWELIPITLSKEEQDVYQRVLIFSRTLFAQFLHQRAEKNQHSIDIKLGDNNYDPNGEYFNMRNKLLKLNGVKEVNQHDILVLLLRLRQICCHTSLIAEMLQGDEDLGDAESQEESEELNLLDQLNKLTIGEDQENNPPNLPDEGAVGLKEATKNFLKASNPVFQKGYESSKLRRLIELVKKILETDDKMIIISQWTGLLSLTAIRLEKDAIAFSILDGKVPVPKRQEIVDSFNDAKTSTQVLLLSLTAGGVGLNLIGANHLFLLDLHWNPQLENQAQDRIYRVGQTKPIHVYKFMTVDTIEERIKDLQTRKVEIANNMLTGSKQIINNKLSLQDLRMLFDL